MRFSQGVFQLLLVFCIKIHDIGTRDLHSHSGVICTVLMHVSPYSAVDLYLDIPMTTSFQWLSLHARHFTSREGSSTIELYNETIENKSLVLYVSHLQLKGVIGL
jgi:hypothetical protein